MSTKPHTSGKPLRPEAFLFLGGALFFGVVGTIYGLLTAWEPVGSTALYLLAGLGGLVGVYLAVLGNRIDPRPEDDPHGEIADAQGEVGVFSPWSWWPLVLGIATALVFLGLAVGFWLSGIGLVVGVIGLVGQLFEFSRGQHAH